ncbi:transposase [Pseudovibrio sp. Tun.PSC04-5.I4]|uniref:transposase n=1 Tax=Pseudovibrio sp. Tun.PSC04-5.I4 TaxID=1798213 RepID=UPI00088522E8|nr:transposase [Pseudovibrio sp. Tun.PSC04-5.I4]SDQ12748.1 Transposase [Pseudovibrio sp. Tun.PSC04-5.I4]
MKDSEERRWSEADKRAVCQEALEGSLPISHVARQHGIRKARLYYWLKDRRFNSTLEGNSAYTSEPSFVPACVVEESVSKPVVVSAEQAVGNTGPVCLEIRLAGGHHINLSGRVSPDLIG